MIDLRSPTCSPSIRSEAGTSSSTSSTSGSLCPRLAHFGLTVLVLCGLTGCLDLGGELNEIWLKAPREAAGRR